MKHPHLNPNKMFCYCVNIWIYPTNKHCTLGVEKEPFYFPLKMDGTICGFISLYPTYDELETCRNVLLSDGYLWDPSNDLFKILSMQEERHTSKFFIRMFSEKIRPCIPDVSFIVYDIDIHNFDRAMINISTWYSNHILENQMITSVSTTFTYKRYHNIGMEVLARKWVMGLKRAQENING